MPLTPADVHGVAFSKPAIGRRGFDANEVDAFLHEIQHELARLIEENTSLRAAAARAADQDSASPRVRLAEFNAVRAELAQAQRERAAAEHAFRAAQAELEQARSQSGPVVSEDRDQQGMAVLMMAQRTADEHVDSARGEADSLLSDARAQARQLTTQAWASAETVERDARQRHQEAMAGLDAKRDAARKQIEDLTGFARDYRNRLTAHLQRQMDSQPSG